MCYCLLAGGGGGSGSQTPDSLDSSGLIPMMETMMQTLLSPDVLYPSVKELSGKVRQQWMCNQNALSACVCVCGVCVHLI